MQDEIDVLHENKTWTLVDKPKDQREIGCLWGLTKKGELYRWWVALKNSKRTCMVTQGNNQKEGVNYNEPFSSVVRCDTLLHAMVCILVNLTLKQHLYMVI